MTDRTLKISVTPSHCHVWTDDIGQIVTVAGHNITSMLESDDEGYLVNMGERPNIKDIGYLLGLCDENGVLL